MIQAFDPRTGIQLSDTEITFYSRFMRKAEHSLKYAKKIKTVSVDLTDALQDAELMFRTAEACTGTRRDYLIGIAKWELTQAREAL
jgi:hypothetical protein